MPGLRGFCFKIITQINWAPQPGPLIGHQAPILASDWLRGSRHSALTPSVTRQTSSHSKWTTIFQIINRKFEDYLSERENATRPCVSSKEDSGMRLLRAYILTSEVPKGFYVKCSRSEELHLFTEPIQGLIFSRFQYIVVTFRWVAGKHLEAPGSGSG